MSSGVPEVGEDLRRPRGVLRRVGGDADVERLARLDGGVQRAHRLLQRRRRVGPVGVEDVDVVEAHPAQRLVQAGEHVLPSATALAVRAGPHVVAGLAGDDDLVPVGGEVVGQVAPEVGLRGAVGRAVVVGQVEVGDAEVEGAAQDRPLAVEGDVVTEVVPQPEADRREVEAAAAGPAVGHRVVAVVGCAEGHVPDPSPTASGHANRPPMSRRPPERRRVGGGQGAAEPEETDAPRRGGPRSGIRRHAGRQAAGAAGPPGGRGGRSRVPVRPVRGAAAAASERHRAAAEGHRAGPVPGRDRRASGGRPGHVPGHRAARADDRAGRRRGVSARGPGRTRR